MMLPEEVRRGSSSYPERQPQRQTHVRPSFAACVQRDFFQITDLLVTMSTDEANSLISKIRHSERILVVVGAGLSRPSGIPTFRDDPWFWERPVEESASETTFKRDPLYVWAVYERLRLVARDASPNSAHAAIARLASAKPNLLTVSQNIDGT